MPRCDDCGNSIAFIHEVESHEIRRYNSETGGLEGIEKMGAETMCVSCANCKSTNVEIEL